MIFPSVVAPLIRHRDDYVVLHDNTTALASFERKSYSEVQLTLKHFELVPASTLNRTDSENHTSNIIFMLVQSYPSVTDEHANNSNIRNVQGKCEDIRNNRGNRPDNWITLDDMNKRTLHDDDVNNHPMHTWRVSHNQMSQVLVLNCANANVKLTYDVNALDIDYFGIPTYLPTQLQHLPLILTIMSAGVWPCILVVWLIYSYKYRQFCLPLHKLITFIPLLRFACSALVTIGMHHLAYHGRIEKFPKISIQVLLAISCFFESASIMLISKGWCITRARLTFMEKRTIWGTAFFTGGAYICQYVNDGVDIGVCMIFFCLVFLRSLSNLWHQREELLRCLHLLIDMKSPQLFLEPYYAKLQVFVRLQWLMLIGNIFPVAMYYAVLTRATDAQHNIFVYLIQATSPAAYFIVLLFIVRPRAPKTIDISKKSALIHEQTRNGTGDMQGRSLQQVTSELLSIRRRFLSFTNNLPPELNDSTNRSAPIGRGVAGAWQEILNALRVDRSTYRAPVRTE